MNMSNYRDIFIEEASENTALMNRALIDFEKNTSDLTPVNELFRAAHTLKGMSATMGYDRLTEFTHNLEELMEAVRSGELMPGTDTVNILYRSVDIISGFVESIREQNVDSHEGYREAVAEMKRILEKKGTVQPSISHEAKRPDAFANPPLQVIPDVSVNFVIEKYIIEEAAKTGLKTYVVYAGISEKCAFKNVRAFMITRNLGEKGEIVKTDPSPKEIEEGSFKSGFTMGYISALNAEDIRSIVLNIAEVETAEAVEVKIEEEKKHEDNSENRPVLSGPLPAAAAGETGAADAAKKGRQAGQTVRVNIEKLDKMLNLVGELVIAKIGLDQVYRHFLPEKEKKEHKRTMEIFTKTVENFGRTINGLQDEVTSVRMLPVSHIFDRYPRVIRDMAAETGKIVETEINGGDIEVDRTVLEEIGDPMIHLIRNAVAHGIEMQEEREKAGKPRKGIIRLGARRERNSVIIEVSDDGRGIDVEKVRTKAAEKKLFSEERLKNMTDDEVVNIVALPGFSTVDVADKVSGRGVGVDAVKTKVESFGGVFRIESYKGEGSKFILKLPLTLAIIQALLVKTAGNTYAIPVIHTVETLEVLKTDIKTIQARRVIILRGEVIPVLSLAELIKREREDSDQVNLVIIEVHDRKIALEVVAVIGQQEIAIKSLGEFLRYAKGFSGVTILGDGSISLIVDIQALLEAAPAEQIRQEV